MARERSTELSTWKPEREVTEAFDELEETFQDIFGRPFFPVAWGRTPEMRSFTPPMEIYDRENEYAVIVELPGVNTDDLDVSVSGDTLTISGERKCKEEVKQEDYYLGERCYGQFERSVTFPTEIDPGKVEADFENGVLFLHIAKSPEAQPKKVQINVTSGQAQMTQGKQEKGEKPGPGARQAGLKT